MKKLKALGTSTLFLLLISLVCAQDIALEYPDEVNYGQEFEITVELMDFSEDQYDIKIDITNDQGSRISQILNQGEWKSTYNYIRRIIDTTNTNEATFSLNITEEYFGTADIEVKVRDSTSQIETYPGYEIEILQANQENNQNNTQENQEEEEEEEETDTYLDLDWNDDDIINGEEFEIEVSAFDLQNKIYDVKLYILDENEELISEIFDEEDDNWKSGNYYLNEMLEGPGEDSVIITIRIDENFRDLQGDATIKARIRETGTTPVVSEEQYEIDILEQEDYEEQEETQETQLVYNTKEEKKIEPEQENTGMIKLNGKATTQEKNQEEQEETQEVKILYESGSEKMKKYAIYALNLILIGIIIFLLINFKNKKN